jgi:hypothetical protein
MSSGARVAPAGIDVAESRAHMDYTSPRSVQSRSSASHVEPVPDRQTTRVLLPKIFPSPTASLYYQYQKFSGRTNNSPSLITTIGSYTSSGRAGAYQKLEDVVVWEKIISTHLPSATLRRQRISHGARLHSDFRSDFTPFVLLRLDP